MSNGASRSCPGKACSDGGDRRDGGGPPTVERRALAIRRLIGRPDHPARGRASWTLRPCGPPSLGGAHGPRRVSTHNNGELRRHPRLAFEQRVPRAGSLPLSSGTRRSKCLKWDESDRIGAHLVRTEHSTREISPCKSAFSISRRERITPRRSAVRIRLSPPRTNCSAGLSSLAVQIGPAPLRRSRQVLVESEIVDERIDQD